MYISTNIKRTEGEVISRGRLREIEPFIGAVVGIRALLHIDSGNPMSRTLDDPSRISYHIVRIPINDICMYISYQVYAIRM